MGGEYPDPLYKALRQNIFIIAVHCTRAGETCFCASMNTGPRAEAGFDIALTEVCEDSAHYFLAEAGSRRGDEIISALPGRPALQQEIEKAEALVRTAAGKMGRVLDTTNIKQLLYENFDHARWDATSRRCLSCANCTMVCPTCFCSTVEDTSSLNGEQAERTRKWDSCFTSDFTYIHGGSIRASVKSCYRQWMTHKLASWIDQFGTSGCVGCGRCITWCPVGIDITEEATTIRKGWKQETAVTVNKE